MQTISPKALSDLLAAGDVELIDVRTPAEFREVHIRESRNVPLDAVDPKTLMASRHGDGQRPIYVTCKSGMRGGKACQKFHDAGFTNVVNLDGGVQAWEAAQLPVVRGKKTMSLERQVRIAAGFLVLLGSLLGFFVHPYFIGISAFVGAGLMFAGITDSCAMGMMLAKMPWNQVRACESGSTNSPPKAANCETNRSVA